MLNRVLMFAASSAVLGMIFGGRVSAATIDLPAVQDATLLGGSDATGNKSLADPGIFVGTDGQDNPKRGLIEFDIADNIPAGATITGVTLNLVLGQVAGSAGSIGPGSGVQETISLYNESQAWGQPTNVANSTNFSGTGHGGNPQTGDATWNYAFYKTTAWSTAGGNYSSGLVDQADELVGTDIESNTLPLYSWSSSAMVADVQNWLDNPSSNFGWLLKNSDETTATDFRAFWSAQGVQAFLTANEAIPANVGAPELVVTYTALPEPGGMALFGAVGGLLLCRGRRIRAKSLV
jgi:hypothetical protein